MTSVIKHALRVGAGMYGSYRPEGWNPKLRIALLGPVPAGAQLVWTVLRPSGDPWFEERVVVSELDEQGWVCLDAQRWEDGGDLAEPGTVAFTVALESELEGVHETLHRGSFAVRALDGEQRYAVDNDWILTKACLCLDTEEDHDAPRLKATAFLAGDVSSYQLEAHCFRGGERIAQATVVDTRYTFTANDGTAVGVEIGISFDGVRGWNNQKDSGWGSEWHLLDSADGSYEVKLVKDSATVRVIPFEVAGGRVLAPGDVEPGVGTAPVLLLDTRAADGSFPPAGATPEYYGDAGTAAAQTTVAEIYETWASVSVPAGDGLSLGADTEAALVAYTALAGRLVNSWEHEMIGAATNDPDAADDAEIVRAERPGYEAARDAAAAVSDDHPADIYGTPTTVGDLRSRMAAILAAAETRLGAAARAEEDELAPYRNLLAGQKLAVFEEHPANAFRYSTTDARVLETPEEIAEAEFWYFEGPLEMPGTVVVDGRDVTVSVQGWRVLGWQFDAQGAIVREFETQGHGMNAPKSAYRPHG